MVNSDMVLSKTKNGCTNCEEWVSIEEGLWGTWQTKVSLSAGKYACGWKYSIPGDPDKVGIDYLQFRECDLTVSPTPADVGSAPSFAGTVVPFNCDSGKYIRGIQVEFLPYQGSNIDDKAITNIRALCFGRSENTSPSENGCQYDNWRNEVLFGRKYICGYQLRIHTGSTTDNTGLNGIRVKLCGVY